MVFEGHCGVGGGCVGHEGTGVAPGIARLVDGEGDPGSVFLLMI